MYLGVKRIMGIMGFGNNACEIRDGSQIKDMGVSIKGIKKTFRLGFFRFRRLGVYGVLMSVLLCCFLRV